MKSLLDYQPASIQLSTINTKWPNTNRTALSFSNDGTYKLTTWLFYVIQIQPDIQRFAVLSNQCTFQLVYRLAQLHRSVLYLLLQFFQLIDPPTNFTQLFKFCLYQPTQTSLPPTGPTLSNSPTHQSTPTNFRLPNYQLTFWTLIILSIFQLPQSTRSIVA